MLIEDKSHLNESTLEVQMEAVKEYGFAIKYIKDPFIIAKILANIIKS